VVIDYARRRVTRLTVYPVIALRFIPAFISAGPPWVHDLNRSLRYAPFPAAISCGGYGVVIDYARRRATRLTVYPVIALRSIPAFIAQETE
jgi:hypothetical protein